MLGSLVVNSAACEKREQELEFLLDLSSRASLAAEVLVEAQEFALYTIH